MKAKYYTKKFHITAMYVKETEKKKKQPNRQIKREKEKERK